MFCLLLAADGNSRLGTTAADKSVCVTCSFLFSLDTSPNAFFALTSLNSDATSGKEMSDGYEGTHSGRGDGRVRKHHRKSSRTRSRQEKISRPKLNILNVGRKNNTEKLISIPYCQTETAGGSLCRLSS